MLDNPAAKTTAAKRIDFIDYVFHLFSPLIKNVCESITHSARIRKRRAGSESGGGGILRKNAVIPAKAGIYYGRLILEFRKLLYAKIKFGTFRKLLYCSCKKLYTVHASLSVKMDSRKSRELYLRGYAHTAKGINSIKFSQIVHFFVKNGVNAGIYRRKWIPAFAGMTAGRAGFCRREITAAGEIPIYIGMVKIENYGGGKSEIGGRSKLRRTRFAPDKCRGRVKKGRK